MTAELAATMAGERDTHRRVAAAAAGRLDRARQTGEQLRARVRSLEAEVASTRRRAEAVVAEQAARTAAVRAELADAVRRNVSLQEAAAAETGKHATVAELRQRLAAGNAAFGRLKEEHSRLRVAAEQLVARTRGAKQVYADWDRLCSALAAQARLQPIGAGEQEILRRWSAWRKEMGR
jgi:chromosome segregation ATPase